MEIRKAPNDTAALSFVANSEAARYVFVVVVVHDVMITSRRYDTFVLAWHAARSVVRHKRAHAEARGARAQRTITAPNICGTAGGSRLR